MGLAENSQQPTTSTVLSVRQLSWKNESKLMNGVQRDGQRQRDARRKSEVQPVQQYIIQNNSTFWDPGENTIYEIPRDAGRYNFNLGRSRSGTGLFANNNEMTHVCREVYRTKIVRDGSIIGYDIFDSNERALLKIHDHGDTTSTVQRTFKAFFRSPVRKWDIENRELFYDLPSGSQLGVVHDVYPDHRVMFPNESVGGVPGSFPRLEMQSMASLGT